MKIQLSDKIQERIDAAGITPLPRWRFVLLRAAFWALAALSVAVGSFAVATAMYLFLDFHRHGLWLPYDTSEVFTMVPFVWLCILGLFVVITERSIKHTRQGYRFRLSTILAASILMSVILGSVLNSMGLGKITHEFFNNVPLYNKATYDSKDAWNRPAIGRLAGRVVSVRNKNDFSVMDFSGRVWLVHMATLTRESYVPEASSTVRMLGVLESSSGVFIARSIHEWEE